MLYLINRLEEDGCGEKIFLSLDANWAFDEDGRAWHEAECGHPETAKRTYAYMVTHAVPVLMAILGRAGRFERVLAARTLGAIGPGAVKAVPGLEALAAHRNALCRWAAGRALEAVRPK